MKSLFRKLRNKKMNRKPTLPISSRQESLETISRNQLAILFDPQLFELRSENQRDKGIDFIGEIKQNDAYTNFRFAIQLKSTESGKTLKSGAISYPIEISNLNYLLNIGFPCFYILYNLQTKQFYIASVISVYRQIFKKYGQDSFPKTYKVQFSQLLDHQQIDKIYKEAFESGTLMRGLNIQRQMQSSNEQARKGFVIDEQQDVYSIEENIAFINHCGYHLLNKQSFSQIVEIEQRTHPRGKASPMFNMVCGTAYYYQGNLLKSVELLKLAHNEIDNLHEEDRSMLLYQLAQAKYLLGLLSESDLKKEISEIVTNKNIGTFLQMKNAYKQFLDSKEISQGSRIRKYSEDVMKIINKHPEFHDMRIIAYAKILNIESTLLFNELANNAINSMGREYDFYRDLLTADWKKFENQFVDQIKELYLFAEKNMNFLALNNLLMEKIEWDFTKIFHFQAFSNWDKDLLTINPIISSDNQNALLTIISDLDHIIETYDRLQHRENQFNCLCTKYEILDFLGAKSEADECSKLMEKIIKDYEMNALRNRLDQLLLGQTKYRAFIKRLIAHKTNIDIAARNSGIYDYMYASIDKETNERLERKPRWSLSKLIPLTYPEYLK